MKRLVICLDALVKPSVSIGRAIKNKVLMGWQRSLPWATAEAHGRATSPISYDAGTAATSRCGFKARCTWTLPLVAEWIKREFYVTMRVRGISAMLKRMNFSFTKATYTLAKADEEAQAIFRKHTFVQLKKQIEAEEIDHLLFEDESMIRSYQDLQYNWFPRGKQRKVPTYGKHEGAKLFAAITYETGQVHHREEEKADVAAFIRFL